MRGEEIKAKIRELEVTLSEKGFGSSVSSFEDICSYILDELLYPVSVLSPIKEVVLNSDQDNQRGEIRNCVYSLIDRLQSCEELVYELDNLL